METKSIEEVDQNAKWVIKRGYKNKGVSKITFDKWNLFNIEINRLEYTTNIS